MTSRQQYTIDNRTILFRPDLNPEDRNLQKQLEYTKYCIKIICKIPLNRIRTIRELQHIISEQDEIVIIFNFDGTLQYHRCEVIREYIVDKMNHQTTKN